MFRRLAFFVAFALVGTFTARAAQAQTTTTTTSGPTISASGQAFPLRLVPDAAGNLVSACPGTPASNCTSTRPQNLNPLGISYADCIADMVLQFSVTLSGFTGADSVEVWGSATTDCTASTDRGVDYTAAVCWGLRTGNIVGLNDSTPQTFTFNVRVQDLVGWQQAPPTPSQAANPPAQGPSACNAQATFAAVPMNVNFLAVNSQGGSDGTPYQYQINTDMVGPPAPGGVGESVGDTIYNVTWTANSDSDTAGYDIFIDPIPGQESGGTGVALEGGQRVVCPDASSTVADTSTAADDDLLESSAEPAAEAAAPLPFDGGCYTINVGGVPPTSAGGFNCNDSVLTGSITNDGGADAETVVATYDDAGNLVESGVEEGVGGISTIPIQYIYKPNSGFTIADKSVGKYTIEGLIDGVTYTTVVASVDGTGNVGPPSPEVCDYPAPVKDFWQNYEEDGGGAGSFCALETIGTGGSSLAGVGCVFALAAVARRRRRSAR